MPDTSNIFLLDNYFFNIHSIPVALTALVVLIFGLAIFIREKASYVGWLFLAYSATFFLWFSGITLVYSAMSPEIALHWIKYA
ncbi:MAG: hypothetical protein OEW97_03615, partial [Gammaproteobacteria bacterium]|nr:hypothetical protein [Gammaproteobacteria bacterium]